MYRTIMVGLDGTLPARRAVSYALILGRSSGARLRLARAVSSPEDAARAAADLDDLRLRLSGQVGGEIEVEVLVGQPGETIAAAASRQPVDLLILAARESKVIDEVIRRARVPVLLVPRAHRRPWPAARLPRVLVPLDGSQLARRVLPSALTLAAALGAELLLLHVIIPPGYTSADLTAYVPY